MKGLITFGQHCAKHEGSPGERGPAAKSHVLQCPCACSVDEGAKKITLAERGKLPDDHCNHALGEANRRYIEYTIFSTT